MHPSLAAMAAYRQFIVYRSVPSTTRPGKTDKFPCVLVKGEKPGVDNPANWTTAEEAERIAASWGKDYGVGFVFTEADPFWFIDIDDCYQDGKWSAIAQEMCKTFAGCAIEVSQSGKGLHIFGTGTPPDHGCRNDAVGLEFYHVGRFAALTGLNARGDASHNPGPVLTTFAAQYFEPSAELENVAWSDAPVEEWRGPADDSELIRRAMRSIGAASAFGDKASFADLWAANETVLERVYPDAVRTYDASKADAALAQHLSFWTGKDCERIERLMRQSALLRDKWDKRTNGRYHYLKETILKAISRGGDVLQDADNVPPPPPAGQATIAPVERSGSGFLSSAEQIPHFAGCIYVRSIHRMFVPGGLLLKPEQFRVQYGGYQFHMDIANTRAKTDAWEAYTQSQAYSCPMVDGTCFKPNSLPGEIVTVSGQTFVNTYFPVTVARVEGDASPFLRHLETVLPNGDDAKILLSYMAACIQYQGVKFQWAPLLQGVEGNGKTLFTRCVAEAIGRRYVHYPPANEISEKFNSWLFDKIFIGVEDIYVPNQKQEILEILKPMLTSDYMAKRAMQTDQVMADAVANFMFNSNHRDAIRKTANDRRFCTLFCAQQQASDLVRDGMNGNYFPALYRWLKDEQGYAIVSNFLSTYIIEDKYNPAKDCQRAPVSSSTAEAVSASAGSLEQEIEEAVHQGYPGFCGSFISSVWLDRMLDKMNLRARFNHHKRAEILEQMGYIRHPALHDGRVNNPVTPDNAKPRLYVLKGSLPSQITTPKAVAEEYERTNANRSAYAAFGAA